MSDSGNPPAGWYADPTQPGVERWWDGQAWSDQTRQAGSPPPPPPQSYAGGVEPNSPGMQGSASGPKRQRSGCFGIAGGVMIGIIGAVVVLVGGCTALLVVASGEGDDLVSVQTSSREPSEQGDNVDEDGSSSAEVEATPESGEDQGDEMDDVVSCTRIDAETIELEVVNNSPKTSSYLLTVGFFDDSGQRLADEPTFLNYLRPGERAIERQFTFEEQGSLCEVVQVDRFAAESAAGELAEVGECGILGEDVFGDLQASVSATNGTPETSDYAIDVAFVDAEGIRRGSGNAFIEAVRPGETAPTDIFSTADYADGYSCEVVGVIRDASS